MKQVGNIAYAIELIAKTFWKYLLAIIILVTLTAGLEYRILVKF